MVTALALELIQCVVKLPHMEKEEQHRSNSPTPDDPDKSDQVSNIFRIIRYLEKTRVLFSIRELDNNKVDVLYILYYICIFDRLTKKLQSSHHMKQR